MRGPKAMYRRFCCCTTHEFSLQVSFRTRTMKGGLVILKLVRKVLSKFLSPSIQLDFNAAIDHDAEEDENTLPEDVGEGHFAVNTVDDGELRRFVVGLNYLADPGFLKLLEQAEQEFGFDQMGILVIPCTCSDLQSVIGRKERH